MKWKEFEIATFSPYNLFQIMRLSVEEGGKFYFYNDVETFEEEPHPYKVVYEEDLCVLDEIYSRQIFLTPFLRWGYYGGLSLALHCICPPGNVYVFFNIVRVGLKFSVCPQTQWILFDFRSASHAPINSKSQHPSPPPPPRGKPREFELLKIGSFKFPPPRAKMVFKCPTLSSDLSVIPY